MRYQYSRWDDTQNLDDLTAEELVDVLSDELIADGDLRHALRKMYRWGDAGRLDGRLPGLQQLLERLRQRRQQELSTHDLGSVVDDIRRRLEEVIRAEREGIERRLESTLAPEPADGSDAGAERAPTGQANEEQSLPDPGVREMLQQMASRRMEFLDNLPQSPAGQLRELSEYEFIDREAEAKFKELQDMLRQNLVQNQFQGLKQAMQSTTPEFLEHAREMMRDLNEMLRQRMSGIEPDFASFKQKHGQMFPPDINSLDELIEHLQRSRAQMQSLLDSLSPEQRRELQGMMDGLMQDEALRSELAQMAMMLDQMMPMDQFGGAYSFQGSQPLELQQAMQLMDRMQGLDDLEQQLEDAQYTMDPQSVDAQRLQELLGREAAAELERLQSLTQILEQAGLIQKVGNNWELTPKAIRRVGQRALRDIFGQLRDDRFGNHAVDRRGAGVDRLDESKRYEFGDAFMVDMRATVMNAIRAGGPGTPVRLSADDFEVFRSEHTSTASTVLMIDMSRSMMLRGLFFSAKKVALALDSLIRGQFPRDNLYIVGFSYLASEMKPFDLPRIQSSEYEYGTNLEHGLMLARRLLARHSGTRQVIVVTDGEPTAHLEGGRVIFNYPPLRETYLATLAEVKRCTKEDIVINTFMLDQTPYLASFVEQMSRLNRGRAFYATPENLGEYLLVDYLRNRRTRLH